MKYDLTWGESVAVRQAFLHHAKKSSVHFNLEDLLAMDYTPFNGDLELIAHTANVIKRQTGLAYKYIFLTNGASGGCTIALRALKILGAQTGFTNEAPYFPLYPNMMSAAGLPHKTYYTPVGHPGVFLLDTPANPSGKHIGPPDWIGDMPVIWDAVYHNNVYSSLVVPHPVHSVVVGSYSKLTGLNGIRLGWIATNDDHIAGTINEIISAEYCGLSKPSKMIMNQLLSQYNLDEEYYWGSFEALARNKLDSNRTEWEKLEKYFDGTPVSPNGMFYYAGMDESAKRLFTAAGVLWQPGSKCGHSDDYARFNLGQDPKIIREAVKSILKEDKI